MTREKYQPFDKEWEKEINKLPKDFLIEQFEVDGTGLKKKEVIRKIRAKLIVEAFNTQYKVGDRLKYLPVANDESVIVHVNVQSEAYVSYSGDPVCFFTSYSGFCSIEPSHIL